MERHELKDILKTFEKIEKFVESQLSLNAVHSHILKRANEAIESLNERIKHLEKKEKANVSIN